MGNKANQFVASLGLDTEQVLGDIDSVPDDDLEPVSSIHADLMVDDTTSVPVVRSLPTESEVEAVLRDKFGFSDFRYGQQETIMHVLRGESVLTIIPTGAGKSLCYQLPTLFNKGATLVVSPLLSLMMDQLINLPHFLPGASINGQVGTRKVLDILQQVRTGNVRILFVAPEMLCTTRFIEYIHNHGIDISLACVDEVKPT